MKALKSVAISGASKKCHFWYSKVAVELGAT